MYQTAAAVVVAVWEAVETAAVVMVAAGWAEAARPAAAVEKGGICSKHQPCTRRCPADSGRRCQKPTDHSRV